MAIRYLSGINVDSNTLFVDDANNRVGIGTASPDYALDLGTSGTGNQIRARRIYANGTGTDSGFTLDSTLIFQGASNSFNITNPGSYPSVAFTINSSGNVGIGTTSPAGSLHIQKNSGNYSNEAIKITGTPLSNVTDGTSATEGYGLYLSYNVSGNRQFVFADTVSGYGVRYIGTFLDGFNKITQSREDLTLGTETNGVHVAAGISNTQFSVSNVGGTASKIVTEIKGAASQTGNYLNISSSSGVGDIVSVLSSGNVGIGTTSPSYKLQVNGSAYFNGTSNTVYFDGLIRFGGTNSYSTVITNSGNVGIGTTSPDTKLHISDTLGNAVIRLERNDTAIVSGDIYGSIEFEGQDVNTGAAGVRGSIHGEAEASLGQMALVFSTADASVANAEKMRITSGGNVGIGTTSPGAKLTVLGNVRINGNIDYSAQVGITQPTSGNSLNITNQADADLTFFITPSGATNKYALIQPSVSGQSLILNNQGGNVGIGTTSPAYKLDVNGDVNIPFGTSNGYRINTNRILSQGSGFFEFGALDYKSTYPNISTNSDGTFRIQSNGSTLVTVNQSGNVGIGTTSPSEKLHVSGNVTADEYKYNGAERVESKNWKYVTTVAAGYYEELGEWRATEGNVVLRITVGSNTAGHSGTAVYILNGGFNQAADGWYELLPAFKGGGHGDAQNGWKVLWYDNASYSYKLAVAVPSGLANKILHVSVELISDLTGDGYYQYSALSTTGTIPSYSLDRTTSYSHRDLVSSDSVTAQYDTNNYTVLGYDSLDTYGGSQVFKTAGTERMRITSAGLVGIGRTTAYINSDDRLVIGGGRLAVNASAHSAAAFNRSNAGNILEFLIGGYGKGAINSDGTNIILDAFSDLLLLAGSSERVRITSTGNVGIGTTSPTGKLHIADDGPNALVIGSAQTSTIGETNNGDYPGMKIVPYNSNIHIGISSTTDNKINLWYAGNNYTYWQQLSTYSVISNYSTNALVLQVNGGNVGIGTTSPVAELHVNGSGNTSYLHLTNSTSGSTINDGMTVGVNASNYFVFVREAAPLYFGTDATERMRITSDGNVGIGTTTPSAKLSVNGDNDQSGIGILNISTQGTSLRLGGNSTYSWIQSHSSKPLYINELGNNVILNSAGGNVGIGTISPAQKLHVVGDARIEGNLTINGTVTQIDTDTLTTEQWLVTNDGTGPAVVINQKGSQPVIDIQDDGTSVMYIEDGGNVGIGTTSPAAKLHVDGNQLIFTQTGQTYTDGSNGLTGIGIRNTGTSASYNAFGVETGVGSIFQVRNDGHVRIGRGGTDDRDAYLIVNGASGASGKAFISLQRDSSQQFLLNTTANETQVRNTGNLPMYFYTNDSIRMTVAAAGNVGIGTTSPSYKLSVKSSGADDGIVLLRNSTSGVIGSVIETGSGDGALLLATNASATTVLLRGSGNNYINSGNFGIGTASPSEKLHVIGKILANNGGSLYIDSNATNTILAGVGARDLVVELNSANRMVISSAGSLRLNNYGSGSKTGTATQRLAVDASGNVIEIPIGSGPVDGTGTANYVTKWSDADTITNSQIFDNGTSVGIGTASPNGWAQLETTGTVAVGGILYIKSSQKIQALTGFPGSAGNLSINPDGGNVGIGTTSPTSQLHVQSASPELLLYNTTTAGGTLNFVDQGWQSQIVGIQGNLLFKTGGTTERMKIDSSGYVYLNTYLFAYENTSYTILYRPNGAAGIYLGGSGDQANYYDNNAHYFRSGAGGTTYATINSSGNVGIGTTSPNSVLHVNGRVQIGNTGAYESVYFENVTAVSGYNQTFEIKSRTTPGSGTAKLLTYFKNNVSGGTTVHDVKFDNNIFVAGAYYDSNNEAGTSGQVLTSTGTGTDWKSLSEITGVDGTGTANYIAKWSDADTITNSSIYDNGSTVSIGLGSTTPSYTNGYGYPQLAIESNLFASSHVFTHNNTDGNFSFFALGKSKGTAASPTIVENSETIGMLQFWAYDGTAYRNTASISNQIDGTPGAGDTPGRLIFSTTNDGSSSASEKMRITNNGSVLIGTTSNPASQKLVVFGDGQFTSNTNTTLNVNSNGGVALVNLTNTAGTQSIYGGAGGQNAMDFYTNSAFKMRIDASGNVGIGTTSPTSGYKLDVIGAIRIAHPTGLYIDTASTYGDNSGGGLSIYNRGTTRALRILSSSNTGWGDILLNPYGAKVGINTLDPTEVLHVSGNVRVTGAYYDSNNSAGTSGQILKSTGTGTDWVTLSEITGVDGTGTANYIAKWSDTDTIANSQIQDNGTTVGIGQAPGDAKLSVAGSSIFAARKLAYTHNESSLDTTGVAVAGLTTGGNGVSALFTFTMYGGQRHYQKVVYTCQNAAGTWYVDKVIDEGTNGLDVVASADSGSTITFTFRARSSTQYYSPAVHVECLGASINTTYL